MQDVNILISSGGRRVALMECCREALRDNGLSGKVFAVDNSAMAPAMYLADRAWWVPRCTDPQFIEKMLALSVRERVALIIPTIDSELLTYAENRDMFLRNGVYVAISDPATVRICRDKVLTHLWLTENHFPTVRQSAPAEILAARDGWAMPLIAKPRNGSASKGVQLIRSFAELEALSSVRRDLIVQEVAPGVEYTINVFVDDLGRCGCAVPHERVEVRSGEVSKAITVKNRSLMDIGASIAERLPGARGMLNIQVFRSATGSLAVIEINARVGGGYPVAHRAGARYTHWLVENLVGSPSTAAFDTWEDDLVMLRYDSAVFQPGATIRGELTAEERRQAIAPSSASDRVIAAPVG